MSSFGGFNFLGFRVGWLESKANSQQSNIRAEVGLLISTQLRFCLQDQGVEVVPLNAREGSVGSGFATRQLWDPSMVPCSPGPPWGGSKAFSASLHISKLIAQTLSAVHPSTHRPGPPGLTPFLSPSPTYKHKQ